MADVKFLRECYDVLERIELLEFKKKLLRARRENKRLKKELAELKE